MITILLTAYKEENSIEKAIRALADPEYSGYKDSIELIQISPDAATLEIGKKTVDSLNNSKLSYLQIQDPQKGKPHALNLGLEKAKGEIVVFTDGDVYFERNALSNLVGKFEENTKIFAVTGRPVSADSRSSMMGYYGHLFADANHYLRQIDLAGQHQERSKFLVKKREFFPMSGYIMAAKKECLDFKLPEDVLVDDAYISYRIFNQGCEIAYEENAICFIKYPKTLFDYFKQKKRSTGGYIQLWKYGIVKVTTKSRNFWQEIELAWFPFKYAKSFREFIWSTLLIPIRLWLWVQIYIEQRILHKDFEKTWVRVESTK